MAPILEIQQLSKHYPDVIAVNNINFEVSRGHCYGLLGPNGAGKTTTMEILEGITEADSGEILYQGIPRNHNYQNEIGIQFQHTSLQDYQTTQEALELFASLYKKTVQLEKLIDLCHLKEFIHRHTSKLSGGQKQRLLLAIALVNDPELLFLDEPTTGLDPQSRRNFWSLIKNIKAAGKTILLTTHYMEEAYYLCDTIAIIDQGKIIIEGQPDILLKQHFPSNIIRFKQDSIEHLPDTIQRVDNYYEWFTDEVQSSIKQLEALGVSLDDCHITKPTLEDLFLKLTGHMLRN